MKASAYKIGKLALLLCLWAGTMASQGGAQTQKKQEDVPDAPSAVKPPQQFPSTPPGDASPPSASDEDQKPDAQEPAPMPDLPTDNTPPRSDTATPPEKPPFNVTTVPQGGATKEDAGQQEELFRIVRNVNQVIVPVRVTNDSGRLLGGLTSNDFIVSENGEKQSMNFFTSDPFALSAAVIFDLGMPDDAVQKVNKTFPALEGAFSGFDEVALYTYSQAVTKMTDFAGVGRRLTAALDELETVRGRNNGPPTLDGPFGQQGPTVNNIPIDPNVPRVATPAKESHVLNDAILRAAIDLSKRDKARRKIIFVVSEGREYGSRASYRDVLRVLLMNNIMVYGIGVGSAAVPVYGRLERLHLPKLGYGNILPKYANATGGEISDELSRTAIENAYSRVLNDARNQYTIGYLAHPGSNLGYREIEVTVRRPDCSKYASPCVRTYAKAGYYPLPPPREAMQPQSQPQPQPQPKPPAQP